MEVITPTNLRKNLFETLKGVATDNSEIEVTLTNKETNYIESSKN